MSYPPKKTRFDFHSNWRFATEREGRGGDECELVPAPIQSYVDPEHVDCTVANASLGDGRRTLALIRVGEGLLPVRRIEISLPEGDVDITCQGARWSGDFFPESGARPVPVALLPMTIVSRLPFGAPDGAPLARVLTVDGIVRTLQPADDPSRRGSQLAPNRKKLTAPKGARAAWDAAVAATEARREETPPRVFAMNELLGLDEAVTHPKYGLGFVVAIGDGSVEVLFADGVKKLAQPRR